MVRSQPWRILSYQENMPAAQFNPHAVARVLDGARTENGQSLVDLVEASPVLLVFLRHGGCTFCREALADIARSREEIEATGTRIVLVHMGDRALIETNIIKYGLVDLVRICDREQILYEAFGLRRGSFRQLLGFKTWWRALWAGMICGHGIARPVADAAQMPGVFYIEQGMVVRHFRHRSAADRPDYPSLCEPL